MIVVFVIMIVTVIMRVIVAFVSGLGGILIVLEGVCGAQLLCLPGAVCADSKKEALRERFGVHRRSPGKNAFLMVRGNCGQGQTRQAVQK